MPDRPAHIFPFSAIVGQETLKTALMLNAIDPRIGGVLIRGEKGTAKSTAVRALAAVLPDMDVVDGCRFACDPTDPGALCVECRERAEEAPLPTTTRRPAVVDLPVSATEDRLVGTIDIEHALKQGERRFEPGLLATANRSLLYVDEVNLLDDHLVDTLLDAAAMGVNTVQREGVSFAHPARFILVGTMNPEEGDVRPQLLDRFGLCIDVQGVRRPEDRVEIVQRRQAFEDDATEFFRSWMDAEDELSVRLNHSRLRLDSVELAPEMLLTIARLCATLDVDGHRADLVMARAASALAALQGHATVEHDHVRTVAPLVLAHRVRTSSFDDDTSASERIDEALVSAFGTDEDGEGEGDSTPRGDGERPATARVATPDAEESPMDFRDVEADLELALDRAKRSISGARQESVTEDRRGRYVRSRVATETRSPDIALDATIRAAAPHQLDREGEMAVNLTSADIRTKVRKRKVGASIVFCVDASGSMGANSRMDAARSAVLDMLVDAYQRRDRVGLVSFRGSDAEIVVSPTASVELAQIKMRSLATGGATPLADGLLRSLEVLTAEQARSTNTIPWLVLVTDGRANVGLNGGLGSEDARAMASRLKMEGIQVVVIDTASSTTSSGAREIARVAGGEYVRLKTMSGEGLASTVKQRVYA